LMRVSRVGIVLPPGRRPMPPDIAFDLGNARSLETFTRRTRDSMSRHLDQSAFNTNVFIQAKPLSSEAFATRAANLGPPRRIGVSVSSGVRGPAIGPAASIRDSILSRLRGKSRFVIIPADSVSAALARTRSTDSLRTWLSADLWAVINLSGPFGSDSLTWTVTLRDFTAYSAFGYRPVSSKHFVPGPSEPAAISALIDNVMQSLDAMDKAPRREPAPARGANDARPPGE
ncbi:MAG: hypothetical protein ABI625_16925, partial [bacterium]